MEMDKEYEEDSDWESWDNVEKVAESRVNEDLIKDQKLKTFLAFDLFIKFAGDKNPISKREKFKKLMDFID